MCSGLVRIQELKTVRTYISFNMEALISGENIQRLRSYSSNWSDRRRSYAQSTSSTSSSSSVSAPRLADVVKEHGLGVHVENWREDMLPVRQYLPMQHIIGSLKRDRDEKVRYRHDVDPVKTVERRRKHEREVAAMSPRSDDSFLDMLRSPKRRRVSEADSMCSTNSDPDRRFCYQAAEHVPKVIPQAALPGLNMVLNLATVTAGERDIFSEYAPKHLEDPQILMNEVLQLREKMMDETYDEETDEFTDDTNDDDAYSPSIEDFSLPIVPPEREAEVRRAFEDFVDLDGNNRFIAKI